MGPLAQAVKWPVISWIVVDISFLITSYVPGVIEMTTPPVWGPLALAFGIWAGYKMVELGGNYIGALVAGLIVGAVCAILTIVGLGVIRGLGVGEMFPAAVLALALNFFGAVTGGGFALTRPAAAARP